MKNRGFTLIEMLAVVVLLGLLIALLFPAISKYIIDTRDNTYVLYESNMKVAAKNMMTDCLETNDRVCVPEYNHHTIVTLSELNATGYLDRLRDPKNSDKFCDPFRSFVVVKNDSATTINLTYEVCLVCGDYQKGTCEVDDPSDCPLDQDQDAPICGSTTGESRTWTNKDKTITVGCSDECSGCVQDVFSKKIDTDTKTTTIDIADKSGKTTACNVDAYVDKTPPTCSLTVVGTLGNNGWYNTEPRPVVKLTAKEDTLSGLSSYGMGTSKHIFDFNKKTEFQVQDGITTVYGYVIDNAGNVGTCQVEVRYDPVPPSVKTVDYGYVVYPKADIASKSENTVSLSSITGEYGNIYGAYIYMKSGNGAVVTVKNNTTTLGTITVPSATSKARVYFNAGSYNKLKFVFEDANQVSKIDRIELLTRDGTSGFYTNQNVTLYINSSDSVSGKALYSFNGGITFQEENYKTYTKNEVVILAASDTSGNVSELVTKTIDNIDKVEPKCTVTSGSATVVTHDNGYYWENVPMKLTKDDNPATTDYAMSGTRRFGLIASNQLTYNNLDENTQTLDTNGTVWYGYVIDRAGNTKECELNVKKDTQNPECNLKLTGTQGLDQWYISNSVDVTFDYYRDKDKDSSQSGLATYDISLSNTPSYNKTTKLTQTTDTTSVTYYGYVKDKAGRTNSCNITFKKDSTKPICTITSTGSQGTNNWYTGNVTISITNTDETSLVKEWDLKDTNSASYNKTNSLTLSTDTTSKTYYGFVKDNAGNTNTCNHTVKRDNTAPTCSLKLDGDTINVESWYSGSTDVLWNTKADATSGVAAFQIDKNSGTPSSYDGSTSKTQSSDIASVTYYGHVKDNAGKTGSCQITFKVDSVKPTCSISVTSGTKGDNNWYVTDVKVGISNQKDQSGTINSGVESYGVGTSQTLDNSTSKTRTTDGNSITYRCYVRDKAGNVGTNSVTFKRDATAPTCALSVTSSGVSFSSKSDALSGLAAYGINTSSTAAYTNSTASLSEAIFHGHVKDNAGNHGECCHQVTKTSTVSNCPDGYTHCGNTSSCQCYMAQSPTILNGFVSCGEYSDEGTCMSVISNPSYSGKSFCEKTSSSYKCWVKGNNSPDMFGAHCGTYSSLSACTSVAYGKPHGGCGKEGSGYTCYKDGSPSYSCPSGYSLSNEMCFKYANYSGYSHLCKSDETKLNNTYCKKNTASCSSGGGGGGGGGPHVSIKD